MEPPPPMLNIDYFVDNVNLGDITWFKWACPLSYFFLEGGDLGVSMHVVIDSILLCFDYVASQGL